LIELFFWFSLGMLFYAYFGYPLVLAILSTFKKRGGRKSKIIPSVSFIVVAHNEEKTIREKIENTINLQYPKERLEVMVVSDGSTDKTEEVIEQFQEQGVKLIGSPSRIGKHSSQGIALKQARGEILAFSDASVMLHKTALKQIVENFADPRVGCVTSEDRIIHETSHNNSGEGLYVKYEMALRRLESRVDSVVGMSGSFFAVRKELCTLWDEDKTTDFSVPIRIVTQGYRAVCEERALAYIRLVSSSQEEFRRKVRTVAQGLWVIFKLRHTLNIFKYGFFSFELLSHKLSRWLVPFWLIVLLLSALFISSKNTFYLSCFWSQVGFYLLGGMGQAFPHLRHIFLFRIPSFFCLVNLSILVAWIKFLLGEKFYIWDPSKR